ncbi:MAG: DUF4760 domain-containing protein [Nitrososphaera sp.]
MTVSLVDILTIIAILASAWGISYQVKKNRSLHAKEIAINLMHQNRFSDRWIDACNTVFSKFLSQPGYDWRGFAQRKYNPNIELSEEEQKLADAVRDILNFCESIAIAVLSGTANEEIIWHDQKTIFLSIHGKLKPYIEYARDEIFKDPGVCVNFNTLIENWTTKGKVIMPLE